MWILKGLPPHAEGNNLNLILGLTGNKREKKQKEKKAEDITFNKYI